MQDITTAHKDRFITDEEAYATDKDAADTGKDAYTPDKLSYEAGELSYEPDEETYAPDKEAVETDELSCNGRKDGGKSGEEVPEDRKYRIDLQKQIQIQEEASLAERIS